MSGFASADAAVSAASPDDAASGAAATGSASPADFEVRRRVVLRLRAFATISPASPQTPVCGYGNFGSGSKAAIAAIQARLGMERDGEPSKSLLKALRK